MLVRSKRITLLKRVTAVCIEAMPAFGIRSSHVPGRVARVRVENVRSVMILMKHVRKRGMVSSIEGKEGE
jgi:hypothetical protein